jgi:hypothetical protein
LDFALVEDAFDFAGALYAAANDDRTKAIGQFEDRLSVLIFQQLGDEAISLVGLDPTFVSRAATWPQCIVETQIFDIYDRNGMRYRHAT